MTERDKRTIKLGAIAAGLILAYAAFNYLYTDYSKTKSELDAARAKFESIAVKADGTLTAKQAGLYSLVPVFEIPEKEDIPGGKFRKKFMEQLKKCGIKYSSLDFLPNPGTKRISGYRTLKLQCKAKCSFGKAMELTAALYENPWFAGVEDFKVECNPKKRTEMELTMTVSTLIKG